MFNSSVLLKDYDLKVTPQRVAIVEELYRNGHMNIDELYQSLLKKLCRFLKLQRLAILEELSPVTENVEL